MHSKEFGIIENVSRDFSREETLEMFRRACRSREFELHAKNAFDEKLIKAPIYLSFGQEAVSSALATSFPGASFFVQHRCHDFYLAYGGEMAALIDELLHRPTGCTKGMGGSASIHCPEIGMFGHDGFIGSQVPVAVGYAFASGKNTLAIFGDGAAEEDYVLSALGYAAHRKLPILFVCVDNNLSILTKVEVRRNWKITDVAASFGMPAVDITDDPWLVMHHVKRMSLPAFLNVRVVRHFWHSGTGVDGEPEWRRFELIKEELGRLGLRMEAESIERDTAAEVKKAWESRLAASA